MSPEPLARGRTAGGRRIASRTWPGLDETFDEDVARLASGPQTRRFERGLEQELASARGKISPFGAPKRVRSAVASKLSGFVVIYHRALRAIVDASHTDERVRTALSLPPELQEALDADLDPRNGAVHLCRLDMLLDTDGGFRVIETNANCPGALLSCGIAARRWREHLSGLGLEPPPALPHERPRWMAEWYLEAARSETPHRPATVALLREDGGNRLELPGLARQLRAGGVEAFEADPRELRLDAGVPTIGSVPLHHAYLKLAVQRLRRLRDDMRPFLSAVRRRALFIQNGLRGRLVGDNKLCLAILSDPTFEDLFDPSDLARLRPHLPWSRRISACSPDEIADIRAARADYVLKRPLDTRGQGIVIGREVSGRTAWDRALDRALRAGWLVQAFCPTTRMVVEREEDAHLHDLSIGVVGGRLHGAMIRSSRELRTNVAISGRLHPVFMEVGERS